MKYNEINQELKSFEKSWRKKVNADLKGKKDADDFKFKIEEKISTDVFLHGTEQAEKEIPSAEAGWLSVVDISEYSKNEVDTIEKLGFDVLLGDAKDDMSSVNEDLLHLSKRTAQESLDTGLNNTQAFKDNQANNEYYIISIPYSNSLTHVLSTFCLQIDAFYNNILTNSKQQEFQNSKLILNLTLSDSFYENITSIRSLRMLSSQINKAWELDSENTSIMASLNNSEWNRSLQHNQISMSAQTISAVLGGADYIKMANLTQKQAEWKSSVRMSANIHHLLRMESYMSYVDDMVKGSFFLDELSLSLTEAVWQNFYNTLKEEQPKA